MKLSVIKRQKQKLEDVHAVLDEMHDIRDETYFDRSDKWQESEKGEDYYTKNEELEDVLENLTVTIDSINIVLKR